jgi:ATP-dependent DNA helicase RecG
MGMTWDDVIDPNITIDKINPSAIEYFKKEAVNSQRMTFLEKESDSMHILENLNLLTEKKFKRAAILLFGKEPHRFYPNAYAKIGRFGKSDTELLSQEIIEGNILQMPDQILEVLEKKYFVNQISYEGLHRKETSPYPYEAIRDVLINAVVHRDYMDSFVQISIYDDKIMFWNAGLLHPSMSLEALTKKHTSRPRNPVLANVFFKAGLVEAWGRGTLKIIEECKKHGLPEPEFAILNGGLSVTIFKDRFTESQIEKLDLNERQKKAVYYVKEKGSITNQKYNELYDVSRSTALRDLEELLSKEIFSRSGEGKGTIYNLLVKQKNQS